MRWVTVVILCRVRLRLVEFLQLRGAGRVLVTVQGGVHVDAVLVHLLICELLCSVWVFLAFEIEVIDQLAYLNPSFTNFKFNLGSVTYSSDKDKRLLGDSDLMARGTHSTHRGCRREHSASTLSAARLPSRTRRISASHRCDSGKAWRLLGPRYGREHRSHTGSTDSTRTTDRTGSGSRRAGYLTSTCYSSTADQPALGSREPDAHSRR